MVDRQGEEVSAEEPNKTQKRRRRWDDQETYMLAAFVKERQGDLYGSSGGAGVEKKKRAAWKEITGRLMATGGVDRGGWEVTRKKWNDVSYRAKQYLKDRIGANKTGGGALPPANPVMEAVLDALPDEVKDGIVPFGTCETLPKVQNAKLEYQCNGQTEEINDTPSTSQKQPVEFMALNEREIEALDKPTSRKRSVQIMKFDDTETEESQSQSQSTDEKKKKKKKSKKKTKTEQTDLLQLNEEVVSVERRKLEIQQGVLNVLLSIDNTLKKLLPDKSALDILNQMQAEP